MRKAIRRPPAEPFDLTCPACGRKGTIVIDPSYLGVRGAISCKASDCEIDLFGMTPEMIAEWGRFLDFIGPLLGR